MNDGRPPVRSTAFARAAPPRAAPRRRAQARRPVGAEPAGRSERAVFQQRQAYAHLFGTRALLTPLCMYHSVLDLF